MGVEQEIHEVTGRVVKFIKGKRPRPRNKKGGGEHLPAGTIRWGRLSRLAKEDRGRQR